MKNVYQEYYEQNKDYQMTIYAYSPPGDGTFKFDGVKYYSGKDFRTVEHYTNYKECGFNLLFTQIYACYRDGDWETSTAKYVLDKALESGIDKCIFIDSYIFDLSRSKTEIVGENGQFKTEKELDEFIDSRLKIYENHPTFVGLQLIDEPGYDIMHSVGVTYRAIKRVRPNVKVQCNLNPPGFIFRSKTFVGKGDFWQRYRKYLSTFLDETGADYIQYDQYPFITGITGIYDHYMRGLREASLLANERGVDFYFTAQSTTYRTNCSETRKLTRSDLFWQINALLGFGVKELAYYTYWSKAEVAIDGEWYPDGYAPVDRMGNKTSIYDALQEVNAMTQKLAPVLKDFKYSADAHTGKWPVVSRPEYLMIIQNTMELKHVKDFDTDREIVFINELYDEKHDRYMYRIFNSTDPYYGGETGEQTTEVLFDEKFKYADVFSNGEWKTVELKDGKYTAKLNPGFADYLILH